MDLSAPTLLKTNIIRFDGLPKIADSYERLNNLSRGKIDGSGPETT